MKARYQQRIVLFDYFKAIAILFVILLHTDVFASNTVLYNCLLQMAVPIFITISGYMFAASSNKKKPSMKEMYAVPTLLRKFEQIIVPALITWILHTVVHLRHFTNGSTFTTLFSIFKNFILGSYGAGSYYCAIMVQFVFIAPLVYCLWKKTRGLSVFYISCATLLFELFYNFLGVSADSFIYRSCILRYLTHIVLGIYMYDQIESEKKGGKQILIMFIGGLVYVLLPILFPNYSYRIFTRWSTTSMMTAFFIYPILYYLILKFRNFRFHGFLNVVMEKAGRSTYYIMYAQMAFFWIGRYIYQIIQTIIPVPFISCVLYCTLSVITSYYIGIVFADIHMKYISPRIRTFLSLQNRG